MLELVSEKIQKAIKFIKGEGKITEENIEKALKEVKLSLLSADVHYKVVKDLIENVKRKALGKEVITSINPGDLFVKIFHDELKRILGESESSLKIPSKIPTFIMLVGLQGVGKTTTAGKLALYLKNQGYNPLLVSIDLKRPAAQNQLKVIAEELSIQFLEIKSKTVKEAVKEISSFASISQNHPIIVDTAGRLHIDDELMDELVEVEEELSPSEVLFVADAMTGADAYKSAKIFNEKLNLTGIILTKLDGDSRGGAALSINYITEKPIKFIGIGEKYKDFEVFHPDRLASRILGMGDIVTLVEKAQKAIDEKKAERLAKKLYKKEFTLEDFLDHIRQLKKLGSLQDVFSMLPKAGIFKGINPQMLDDKKILHMEAIILSMTKEERRRPEILNGKRKLRIARGSGRPVSEVNRLIKQYREMKKMVKKGFFKKLLKFMG